MSAKSPREGSRGACARRDPTFRIALDNLGEPAPAEHRCSDPSDGLGPRRVYFLHVPAIRRVKIGCSTDPGRRRHAFKRELGGCPTVLLGSLNGGFELEHLMHQRFAEHRVSGEWFSDAILEDAETLIRADREFYGVKAA